jgi:hypothetical protein
MEVILGDGNFRCPVTFSLFSVRRRHRTAAAPRATAGEYGKGSGVHPAETGTHLFLADASSRRDGESVVQHEKVEDDRDHLFVIVEDRQACLSGRSGDRQDCLSSTVSRHKA